MSQFLKGRLCLETAVCLYLFARRLLLLLLF